LHCLSASGRLCEDEEDQECNRDVLEVHHPEAGYFVRMLRKGIKGMMLTLEEEHHDLVEKYEKS
jgi:hypothetical protein